ncbi:competence type IV pilus minor pilin ComGG [Streptococcus merionis]|uniref:Late competence protein ComGG n=1 Tax=Streptococcus merionis TaxID=400065 RepID=A0A239T0F9_9STRE|nr:competence type IV pilus minor pilin ComGG [Streptococcus merionis]SNU91210.1 Late competence protein ComGG [Streptococcus merionis]
MPWKRNVKAGLMLYALLMLTLFSLLLQFYLNRQVTLAQTNQANAHSLTAYAMAQWTRDKVTKGLEKERTEKMAENPKEVAKESEQENEGQIENEELINSTDQKDSQPTESRNDTNSPNHETVDKQPSKNKASEGQITFDKGIANYHMKKAQLNVTVWLSGGQEFSYTFPINGEKP